jgi:hypothetical protein
MKTVGLTMMTTPEYRQDPWKESIRQALEIFDQVVVVYGDPSDEALIQAAFYQEPRLIATYLHWPQPVWSYEELPRHLNHGLDIAKTLNPDWVIKFDLDNFFHEKDKALIMSYLLNFKAQNKWIVQFNKFQFFLADRCYEKGKMSMAINMKYPICYGQEKERYTDLCQPIIAEGSEMIQFNKEGYSIPHGVAVPKEKYAVCPVHVWNYDYTFKTEERAKELLYEFDKSHARWWGAGYTGRKIENITPESALEDYLDLVRGRVQRAIYHFTPKQHPKHVIPLIENIKAEQFGHSLWGKVTYGEAKK